MRIFQRFLLPGVAVMVISGCSISPTSFTEEEYITIIQNDRAAWLDNMEVVSGPICLDEAIARALKYNLDHRVRLMEQAHASAQFEAGKFDMLPKLMANAGYHWRDNENIRDSIDSVTGTPSLANPSISSERERTTADLTLSWSILDFGLGYYNAKQNADRILVASERRRRAMHGLIQNVTTTYWRALAAQQLEGDVRRAIDEAEMALADSQQILLSRLRDPTETLRYQRNLLENLRLLENVDRELSAAKIELASLIGLPPGSQFELIEPARADLNALDVDIEELEAIALSNNADLREQSYNARIAAQETRKTLLRMMPGLSFNYGHHYDSDRYLINQQWRQASLNSSYNLFNILSTPANHRASEYGLSVAETRRMAVQLAVLSQLHLAKHQYHDALRQYLRAESIFEVDSRLSELALGQERTQMGSPQERISRDVTRILSTVRMYQAMARANEASARIQATLGLEPHFSSLDEVSLTQLRDEIVSSYDNIDIGIGHQWNCVADVPAQAAQAATRQETLRLDASLLFDIGKSELAPQAFDLLNNLVETLRHQPAIVGIEVVGHTDNVGSAEFNQRLSQARAEKVSNYLVERGMDASLMAIRGAGFNEPAASNNTPQGRQQNRRVEIIIEYDVNL